MNTQMSRDKLIQIRVSEKERERIEKLSKAENFGSIADYIRKIALDNCDKKGV